jgi:hypothetical protein
MQFITGGAECETRTMYPQIRIFTNPFGGGLMLNTTNTVSRFVQFLAARVLVQCDETRHVLCCEQSGSGADFVMPPVSWIKATLLT